MIQIALCSFPLWKNTTNGSIQCFIHFVTHLQKGLEDKNRGGGNSSSGGGGNSSSGVKTIWVVLSALTLEENNPHKANVKCLYEQQNMIYITTPKNPDSQQKLIDHLNSLSQHESLEMVSCDMEAGIMAHQLQPHLRSVSRWTHLCTLHMAKNAQVLLDRHILHNSKIVETFQTPERMILSEADAYVTVSRSELDWIGPQPKASIYHPERTWWPSAWWEKAKSDRRYPLFYLREKFPDKLLLLYVGRLTYQKGIDLLVKITLPSNVHLCIMSSSEFSDETLSCCHSYVKTRYESATWLGPYFGDEKIRIMSQCDGVICPSIYEPYGLVGLESILFARTVLIASAVDGMKDYLVEGGYIPCGTTLDTVQSAVTRFSTMALSEREEMARRAESHALKLIK